MSITYSPTLLYIKGITQLAHSCWKCLNIENLATPGQLITCFLAVPSVRYKQYKTTAGMYISKSASRTLGRKEMHSYSVFDIEPDRGGLNVCFPYL